MARKIKPITTAQIRAIHTMTGKLRIDHESYKHLIARHGQGVTTSTDLTQSQASAVIRELEYKLGERPTPAKPTRIRQKSTPNSHGNVTALVTPDQQRLINDLIVEVDWHQYGGFASWLAKFFKLKAVRTKEQAQKVINGLKGLKKHGHTKKDPRNSR